MLVVSARRRAFIAAVGRKRVDSSESDADD